MSQIDAVILNEVTKIKKQLDGGSSAETILVNESVGLNLFNTEAEIPDPTKALLTLPNGNQLLRHGFVRTDVANYPEANKVFYSVNGGGGPIGRLAPGSDRSIISESIFAVVPINDEEIVLSSYQGTTSYLTIMDKQGNYSGDLSKRNPTVGLYVSGNSEYRCCIVIGTKLLLRPRLGAAIFYEYDLETLQPTGNNLSGFTDTNAYIISGVYDGEFIYTLGITNKTVRKHSVATGAMLSSWTLGAEVAGIVSNDAIFLEGNNLVVKVNGKLHTYTKEGVLLGTVTSSAVTSSMYGGGADASNIFCGSADGKVYKLPLSAVSSEIVSTQPRGTGYAHGIAKDATHVYVFRYTGSVGYIEKLLLDSYGNGKYVGDIASVGGVGGTLAYASFFFDGTDFVLVTPGTNGSTSYFKKITPAGVTSVNTSTSRWGYLYSGFYLDNMYWFVQGTDTAPAANKHLNKVPIDLNLTSPIEKTPLINTGTNYSILAADTEGENIFVYTSDGAIRATNKNLESLGYSTTFSSPASQGSLNYFNNILVASNSSSSAVNGGGGKGLKFIPVVGIPVLNTVPNSKQQFTRIK